MENRLTSWIEEQVNQGVEISEKIMKTKARHIYDCLCQDVNKKGQFKASEGWFYRFKVRTGIKSVRKVGESAEVPQEELTKFVLDFAREVREGGYSLDQDCRACLRENYS